MRAVSLLLLLAAAVCVLSVSGKYQRRYHHQGESLKKPGEFLDGVNEARFREAFETSYKNTRKSEGTPGNYSVGAGIADVTGQIAEIGFMVRHSTE